MSVRFKTLGQAKRALGSRVSIAYQEAIMSPSSDGTRVRTRTPKSKGKSDAFSANDVDVSILSPIHQKLWALVVDAFIGEEPKLEFKGAVPGRRFSLDISFPQYKICIEVDGWKHHGKYLSDFKKDRIKQNLLTLNGWSILRFSAEAINKDPAGVINQIRELLYVVRSKSST